MSQKKNNQKEEKVKNQEQVNKEEKVKNQEQVKEEKEIEKEVKENSNEESQEKEEKNIANLEEELQKCQEALKEKENEYLRAYADLENTKKRLQKEKDDAVMYANEKFASDLLVVLDTFENALNSIEQIEKPDKEAIEKIKEGVALTYEQLLSVLKKHGVEEIVCENEFDPHLHQAVMQEESDEHESGEIVKVLQKGYKLKNRLLRAAMVSTCK